jgi:Reverse transcriptase (RNA-dependent DNA polymerase)
MAVITRYVNGDEGGMRRLDDEILVLCLNARSIVNKFSLLELYLFTDLGEKKVWPNVIFVSETHLQSTSHFSSYDLVGYKAFHFPRPSREGGGISFYIKNDLSQFVSDVERIAVREIQFLLIKLSHNNITLCGVYRPPTNANFSILEEFFDNYELIASRNRIIFCGDFNINLLDPTLGIFFTTLATANGLSILNPIDSSYPTRNFSGSTSIIDHVHTNLQLPFKFQINDCIFSDHNAIFFSFPQNALSTNEDQRVFKTYTNYENVSRVLRGKIIATNFTNYDDFHVELVRAIEHETKSVLTNPSTKANKPWFNGSHARLWKLKRHYYRLSQKFPLNNFFKLKFKNFSHHLIVKLREAKKKYFNTLYSKNANDSRKIWQITNELINNGKKAQEKALILKINDSIVIDKKIICNHLVNHFCEVGTNLSFINQPFTHEFSNRQEISETLSAFSQINTEEITILIKKLDKNVSRGIDNVPAKFLKDNIDFFTPLLTKFINTAFEDGNFPDSLKCARITAIYKGQGEETNVNNFRPISVLPAISKIFEKSIKTRLVEHLNKNKIINVKQYGFIEKSNTTTAASCLANAIHSTLNSNNKCAVLFLDIVKAFDCVSFEVLRKTLINIGVTNKALNLLTNYFENRKQTVCIQNEKSDECLVTSGCAQGSILGPTIFLIYINDIMNLKLNGDVRCFADDGSIHYSAPSYEELKKQMEEDLRDITSFFRSLNMSLSSKKTKFIIFRYKNQHDTNIFNNLHCDGDLIERVDSIKYLGIIFDQLFTFKEHANKVMKSIAPFISILSKIRYYTSKKTLMQIYYAHIHSRLIYCLPVWQSISETQQNQIQRLQNRALKLINFLPRLTPSETLYSSEFLSFEKTILYECILFIYKICAGLTKSDVLIKQNSEVVDRTTRQSSLLRLPVFTKSSSQKDIFFRGISLFNKFSTHFKPRSGDITKAKIGEAKIAIKKFVFSL